MLYLDYSRKEGEWLTNVWRREHLEAVAFLRRFNEIIHTYKATSYAEESTAWPGVRGLPVRAVSALPSSGTWAG